VMSRQDYDYLHKRVAWKRRSRLQLATHPLCKMCFDRGVITAAAVADHVIPHRGDVQSFYTGDLQSLCLSCHSQLKQQIENNGYARAIGPDGYPTDKHHPFWVTGGK
jgi:5-methylcytosine-specific restriction protein A